MSNVPPSVTAPVALLPRAEDSPSVETFTPPATDSLRSRTVRGSAWSITDYAVATLLRLGGNLLLARLLVPEMFGLMALVNIFIYGLGMFSDIGIGPSLIQNPRGDDPKFYNTAWTIQVFRGMALWVCSCLIAIPLAQFYEQPQLAWLIPVAGLSALISGFNSTSLFRLHRHLQLRRLTIVSVATQVIIVGGMIAWALVHKSVWALLVPTLLGKTFQMIASHLLMPDGRNRFDWDAESKAALLKFGKWIFLSTLLNFSANQADRLIFAKHIPWDLLGVYGIALMLATMPALGIAKIGASVVFPAYSSVRRDAAYFGRVFAQVRFALLVLGAAAVTALVATGPLLIDILYDAKWSDAGWILPLLAAGAWFQILECTNSSALLAHGRPHWLAGGYAAKLVGLIVLIPIGFHRYGFAGAVVGVALAETFRYAVSAIGVRRLGLRVVLSDLLLTLAIAAAVAVTIIFGNWLHRTTDQRLIAFGGSILMVCLIWAPLLAIKWRDIRGTPHQPAAQIA